MRIHSSWSFERVG